MRKPAQSGQPAGGVLRGHAQHGGRGAGAFSNPERVHGAAAPAQGRHAAVRPPCCCLGAEGRAACLLDAATELLSTLLLSAAIPVQVAAVRFNPRVL